MAERRTVIAKLVAGSRLFGSIPKKAKPLVLIHGGAGTISEARVPAKIAGIHKAVLEGYAILKEGGCALDAVEAAVRSMELDEIFNAGYGSALNLEGNVELDASIMEGKCLEGGCVTMLEDIMHPVSVARRVMEKTKHTFVGGKGAMRFAAAEGFNILQKGSLVTESAKQGLAAFLEMQKKGVDTALANPEVDKGSPKDSGTVGAVAIDCEGTIAAATSTGGITGKIPGRIGDSPILGCGTYADNDIGGVSVTGHGEIIMRYGMAAKILQKMKYKKISAQVATEECMKEMTARLTGEGGAITVDKNGNVGIYFSSKSMAWAYVQGNKLHYGIKHGEHNICDL